MFIFTAPAFIIAAEGYIIFWNLLIIKKNILNFNYSQTYRQNNNHSVRLQKVAKTVLLFCWLYIIWHIHIVQQFLNTIKLVPFIRRHRQSLPVALSLCKSARQIARRRSCATIDRFKNRIRDSKAHRWGLLAYRLIDCANADSIFFSFNVASFYYRITR